jgi:flagellar hook-associated protein 2
VKASDTAQTISITKGVDVSSAAINTLIKAYNELMSSYKEMTANSSNSSKPGTFANSPTALSFINQIKASFAKGISYTEGGTLKTMSLSTLGIDLQLDGTAKFNSANYATASANGLQDVLALGVAAGYIDSSNNLNTFLTSQVKTGGVLDLQIQSENNSVRNLTKRQDDLQTRLNSVQNNLISQYSALNALLFQLNNTSTALTSALDALTNSQSNN